MTSPERFRTLPDAAVGTAFPLRRDARHAANAELLQRVLAEDDGRRARITGSLLRRFGSLRALAHATPAAMLGVPGVGPRDIERLEACFELGRRLVYGRPLRRRVLEGPEDVAALLMPRLRDLDREHFVTVLLSTKNQVLDVLTVAIGSLSASLVHPREVLKPAVQASAAALVVAHNHPTGVPAPSREDIEFTRRLARCGELLGIRLLDHVIIGDGTFESLKTLGHL